MSSSGVVARGSRTRTGGRFSAARLHHPGAAPFRVLLVGDADRLWAEHPDGVGLAEHLVAVLGERGGRGVDLDVLWDVRPVVKAMLRGGGAQHAWRYDAVIVMRDGLGQVAPGRGVQGHERLRAQAMVEQWAELSGILLVAVHDGGEQPPVHEIQFGAPDGSDARPQPALPAVAAMVVDGRAGPAAMAELIAAQALRIVGGAEHGPEDDAASERQALVDLEVGRGVQQRIDTIVRMARDAFGMDAAAVDDDHDGLRTISAAGAGRRAPGGRTPGRTVVTVVPDTWQQPDLAGDPTIQGPDGVRFYAAHPIESADGRRMGSLSVFDSTPHDPAEFDLTLLRDLALLAEGEIIEAAGGGPAAAPRHLVPPSTPPRQPPPPR